MLFMTNFVILLLSFVVWYLFSSSPLVLLVDNRLSSCRTRWSRITTLGKLHCNLYLKKIVASFILFFFLKSFTEAV